MSADCQGRTGSNPSVLFLCDPMMGHVTANLRGLIFRKPFLRDGWRVEFLALRPSWGLDRLRYYRLGVRRLFPQLPRISPTEAGRLASGFDIVYLLKVRSLPLVRHIRRNTPAKLVFELTDALWLPHFQAGGWRDLDDILSEVHAVFSENQYVCDYGRRHNPNVFSLPVCTQVERFDELRAELPPRRDGRVVVGWIGSPSTVSALASLAGVLDSLASEHPNLHLRALGCKASDLPAMPKLSVSCLNRYDETQMIREAMGMDIGIFPPPGDLEDYAIRGALKGLIYMTAGIPPICQDAGDCARIIRDGENGFLASSLQQWRDKLHSLIIDQPLRRRLGAKALESIRAEHSLEHVYQCLRRGFEKVLEM